MMSNRWNVFRADVARFLISFGDLLAGRVWNGSEPPVAPFRGEPAGKGLPVEPAFLARLALGGYPLPLGTNRSKPSQPFVILGIILWVVGGCGYRMVGQIGGNPQGIERIAIPLLQNHTLQTGVELTATEALRDEFRLSPSWEIVPREEAEGVLLGKVTRYETAPTTFVEGQTSVLAFALVMEVELELQDRKGKMVWRGAFDGEERYDLADTLLRTEDNEREAARRLVQRLMREVRESIQLDF